MSEGMRNDALLALLGVMVAASFAATVVQILVENTTLVGFLTRFATTLVAGILVGGVMALALWVGRRGYD
ncbi:hypothetical protein [Natrinema versiforme]|uniref:Uncharacterized protein n=2 Tax=root TaxID=1 RepID=A0A4V1G0F1_9EURY|nr:hypothetical protein [Natrinema versiforme]YP_010772680.1 hypothetical protein QIT49_gp13 [Natrinema versiforme icosahedral virus 1]QCS45126.1 hypothetical protein FEJ81_22935 [Natrinema versiforme]DAC85264.1 TPA_asm: hypothetical protein NVIV1gp25 [Natrinema versiforme icosahedral virus 1]